MYLQDCVLLVVALQPYKPAPAESFDFKFDMDLSGRCHLWYSRPQLFFRCTVCPTCSLRHPRQHKELALVFVSTFEPTSLIPNAVMQRNEVPIFYYPASSSNPASPACTFAWLGMSSAEFHQRHASYKETGLQPS